MGNSASKKALLTAAEQRAATIQSNLAAREAELSRVSQNLLASKSETDTAANEIAKLRKLIQDLDVQYAAVDEERRREIERLHGQVRQKGSETVAQQQVSKLRTAERDDARAALQAAVEKSERAAQEKEGLIRPLRERVAELEAALAAAAQERESRRGESAAEVQAREEQSAAVAQAHREASAAMVRAHEEKSAAMVRAHQEDRAALTKGHEEELALAQEESRDLTEKLAALRQNNRELAEQLAAVKLLAAEEIAQAKAEAAANLNVVRPAAAAPAAAIVKQTSASRALAMRIWKLAKGENAVLVADSSSPRLRTQSSTIGSSSINLEEPATPTPALTSAPDSPSSSPERENLSASVSSLSNPNRDFNKPVRFSLYPRIGKDLRIEVEEGAEEVTVEIREWHRGVRSFKGISIPVGDAGELVKILPEVVRLAELKEERILKADLQREAELQKEALAGGAASVPHIQIEA